MNTLSSNINLYEHENKLCFFERRERTAHELILDRDYLDYLSVLIEGERRSINKEINKIL